MSKTETGTAREILSDYETLARRDRNAFDGGFQAGVERHAEIRAELLEALKQMTAVCGACFRVISGSSEPDALIDALEVETQRSGIPDGFGARANAAISKAEGK